MPTNHNSLTKTKNWGYTKKIWLILLSSKHSKEEKKKKGLKLKIASLEATNKKPFIDRRSQLKSSDSSWQWRKNEELELQHEKLHFFWPVAISLTICWYCLELSFYLLDQSRISYFITFCISIWTLSGDVTFQGHHCFPTQPSSFLRFYFKFSNCLQRI